MKDIIHLESIPSTNTYAKDNIETLPKYAIIFADDQVSGRGRIGHVWKVEPKKNIITTIVYKDYNSDNISLITIAVGIAVEKFLKKYLKDVSIKWPNDIYVKDQKICGILCENVLIGTTNNIVIGIGINVNQTNFDNLNATSIKLKTGKDYDLMKLLSDLERSVRHELFKFKVRKNKVYLIRYLNNHLYGLNEEVSFIYNNEERIGNIMCVAIDGGIIIKSHGEFVKVISGEVKFIK